jgi:hypothetical protein
LNRQISTTRFVVFLVVAIALGLIASTILGGH